MFDIRQRRRQPEVMDQPDLDDAAHQHALRGLARLNWWSNSAGILWPAIRRLARRDGAKLRLLDIASGGGDVPLRLWRRAQRGGVELDIAGCDVSDTALAHARDKAQRAQADIHFFQHDVLAAPLPGDYDILTCSLFLHHLDNDQARALLRQCKTAARRMLLINDLRRDICGLLLTYAATRLLTTSPVVHVDGPLSVRAAFTMDEVQRLCQEAGLEKANISRKWPFRFLLIWENTI